MSIAFAMLDFPDSFSKHTKLTHSHNLEKRGILTGVCGLFGSGNWLYLPVLQLALSFLSSLPHEPVAMDATRLFCASGSTRRAPTPTLQTVWSDQVE